ncbi:MAG: dihydrofolate reductase, partial [Succinivibrio sp.]
MASVEIIVALAENFVIGKDCQIPWHLSEDLKHFKEITTGYPVVMGRRTFESIGKCLPNRRNIMVSST